MARKAKKHLFDINKLIGNDYLYLFLQLVDYPEMGTGEIAFSDLQKIRFKNLKDNVIYRMLKSFEEMGALEIEEVKFNSERIIKVSEKTIKFIQSALKIYIDRFINGELITFRETAYHFTKHREIFFEEIEKRIKYTQPILSFSDYDFNDHGNKFYFFECLLAMVRQKEIEIKYINNETGKKAKAFYNISFVVNNEQMKQLAIKKEKQNAKLRCFKIGGMGYFEIINDEGKQIREIGATNSRHYMLLRFLCENHQRGKRASFQKVFDEIKSGKSYGSRLYADDVEISLKYAKKSLLKKNKQGMHILKPYEIAIDEKLKKIWIE